MGRVDLVVRRDGRFLRLFAQKRLRPHLVDDEAVRRMFLDEGRIAGLVRHPNVVSVVDVGEDDAGPYLVMDFVEGVSLADLVARVVARRERVPIAVALRIALQIAEGLHAVHQLRGADGELLQLVHRDVSPQNVLLGFDGIARVTDFGIAKALGRASRTTTGVLKGKLGYFAPERLRFEEPDQRADLFSFGVVLFEMLAGRRLYDGTDDVEGPRRILHEPPPDITDERDDIEPELVELMFELLAKDRAHRPPDAGAVARRLEQISASAVAAHGAADTSAYLGNLFAEERARLHDTLQANLARIETADAPARVRRARPAFGAVTRATLAAAVSLIAVLAIAAGRRSVSPAPATDAPPPATATTAPTATRAAPAMPATHIVATEVAPLPAGDGAGSTAPSLTSAPRPRKHRHHAAQTNTEQATTSEDCSPPYTVDADGERHFKLRCLVDVRR
jgi:serine/threonine-protein kinase